MSVPTRVRSILTAAAAALAALAAAGVLRAVPAEEPRRAVGRDPALDLGMAETARVSLTLLDVEVVDKTGKPMPGLTKDDFVIRLNGDRWPLYSVDDLCACADTSSVRADRGPGSEPGSGEAPDRNPEAAAGSAADPGEDAVRFVLYLDFSQLQVDGRSRAVVEAERWLREIKRPRDLVSIVAYAKRPGLREVCPFTTDLEALTASVARVSRDSQMQDPYATLVRSRIDRCKDDTVECERLCRDSRMRMRAAADCSLCHPTNLCVELAHEESAYERDSLRTLKEFVTTLAETPGRKALVYFHQNGMQFPGRLYGAGDDRPGEHGQLLAEIGAEATLARTTIHAASMGDRHAAASDEAPEIGEMGEQAVNLSSNLADYTGGTYNRDLVDLAAMTSEVRTRCTCLYRLGIEPPEDSHGRIYNVLVRVRGRKVPHLYTVQFLGDLDRWLRQAVAVLRHPERAKDLEVAAALVPTKASGGLWDVSVQIALDVDALSWITERDGSRGSWEAGGLLVPDEGPQEWEMMSVSSVRRATSQPAARVEESVLHQRTIEGLKPGRYSLKGFVRDRMAGVLGGAEASIELPEPHKDTLAGPLLFRSGRRHLLAPLPLFRKDAREESHVTEVRTGTIPATSARILPGEPLVAVTWLCPSGRALPVESVLRYIARDGVAQYRLETPVVEAVGDCFRVTDRLITNELIPGNYAYVLGWRRTADEMDPVHREAAFTVHAAPASGGSPPPTFSP